MDFIKSKIHPLESSLKSSLQDSDLHLVYNHRLGFWVVAIWDQSRHYPAASHLMGCEGVHEDSGMTHWYWVFSCMIPQEDGDGRAYTPIEPGQWLIQYLRETSARTREDLPNDVRYGPPHKWAEWLMTRNEAQIDERRNKEQEEYYDEVRETIDHHLTKGKKTFHGDVSTELR